MNNTREGILGMQVNITCLTDAINQILFFVDKGQPAYVCLSNVHMCMEAFDSAEFSQVVNQADLVIPDGKPLSWAQRLLGHSSARQVRGQDIMNAICESSAQRKLNIGLYGGSSDELLRQVVSNLKSSYPDIVISFTYSPPFRPLTAEEDLEITKRIHDSGVNILFVGIGCPKQERWMAQHKAKLNCVMLGVGAAYDFIAGSKKHAPRWIQKIGLEWLFRLCSEPARLWKRYLQQNPRFIYYFSKQLIRHKLDRGKVH